MELKTTQEMIGDCGIILQQVEGECLYEIGYHLHRDFWGHGLATEPPSPVATGPSRTWRLIA